MPRDKNADEGRASGETPRGAAQKLRSSDARMGEPGWSYVQSLHPEKIGVVVGTR